MWRRPFIRMFWALGVLHLGFCIFQMVNCYNHYVDQDWYELALSVVLLLTTAGFAWFEIRQARKITQEEKTRMWKILQTTNSKEWWV